MQGGPQGVAVDSAGDTVFVTNADSNSMSIIDGKTANVKATIDGLAKPIGVAVNEADDIVYVAQTDDSSVVALTKSGMGSRTTIDTGGPGWALAVDQDDDTVYATAGVTQGGSGSLAVIDGTRQTLSSVVHLPGMDPLAAAVNDRTDRVYVTGQNSVGAAVLDGGTLFMDDTIPLIGSYWSVAVDQADDTAYFANYQEQGSLAIVAGRTSQVVSNRPLGYPWGVAVAQRADRVYVTRGPTNSVSTFDAITGRSASPDIAIGGFPIAVAVDQSGENAGTVYVASSDSRSVSVLASVRPAVTSEASGPGSNVVVTVESPQAAFDLAARAVTAVCFVPVGDTAGSLGGRLQALPGDRWKVRVPTRLASGAYRVVVTFDGGLQARAGRVNVRPPG